MSLNKLTLQKSFAISAGASSGKTYTLRREMEKIGAEYNKSDKKLQVVPIDLTTMVETLKFDKDIFDGEPKC